MVSQRRVQAVSGLTGCHYSKVASWLFCQVQRKLPRSLQVITSVAGGFFFSNWKPNCVKPWHSSYSFPVANTGDEGIELLQPFWSWEFDIRNLKSQCLKTDQVLESHTVDQATNHWQSFLFSPLSPQAKYSNRENKMYWNISLFQVFALNSCVSGE